jgi:ParB family chromosome partitioning protein
MSKVTKKGTGIDFDGLDDDDEAAAPKADDKPRTAIGAISVSLAMGRGVEAENKTLKEKLAQLEGREYVELLDPKRIRASKYANRHPSSFCDQAFEALREEIVHAGRNVQPIKVRPVTEDPEHDFEIVYGHRRHRACLELGIVVAATIADLNDQELFAEMDRENRDRESLSPWEQGRMYQRALQLGLYPSARKLAQEVGVTNSTVSTAIQLASLPDEIVRAFTRPQSLQYRWAVPLSEAVEKNRDLVLKRAAQIEGQGDATRTPKAVFAQLLAEENDPLEAEVQRFKTAGKTAASYSRDPKGGLTLKVRPGILSPANEAKLLKFVEGLFKE